MSVLLACLIAVKTHRMCVKPSMTKCTTVATVISIEDHTMQSATTGKIHILHWQSEVQSIIQDSLQAGHKLFCSLPQAVIIAPSKQRLADESFHPIAVHRLNNIFIGHVQGFLLVSMAPLVPADTIYKILKSKSIFSH